jgi:hypothetical protein
MKILIACEYSGIVRDAFRKKGHDAWSCDILPCDGDPKYHYQCDIFEVLDKGWDMMIAHPPCTYLSNAGARFLYQGGEGVLNTERFKIGGKAAKFFMKLLNAPIEKICVENPIPSTIFRLPRYTQIIQPYYFGHPVQKKTCLWLKNLPELKPTDIIAKPQSTKIAGNWFNKGGKDRQKNRSKTFQGIADAMANQWG